MPGFFLEIVMPRIVLISDTHGYHGSVKIPEGDVLIHAGDFSMRGALMDLRDFCSWFASQPHAHKIFIAGNHDWCFERQNAESRALVRDVTYLQDSGVTCCGLKVYGSPWQPWFMDWAFNVERGEKIAAIWARIPVDTDILVTHGPPARVLDAVAAGPEVGCEDLLQRVENIQPKLHVFGHIHEGYGERMVKNTHCVNASICDEHYRPRNVPIVIEVPPGIKRPRATYRRDSE